MYVNRKWIFFRSWAVSWCPPLPWQQCNKWYSVLCCCNDTKTLLKRVPSIQIFWMKVIQFRNNCLSENIILNVHKVKSDILHIIWSSFFLSFTVHSHLASPPPPTPSAYGTSRAILWLLFRRKKGRERGREKSTPPFFLFSLSPTPFDACYAG